MSIGVIYLFELVLCISLGKHPEMELLGVKVVLFLIFGGASLLLSTVAAPILTPTNSAQGLPFLPILSNTCRLLIS